MLDKICENDTIDSVCSAASNAIMSKHHWKIYLRNGAILDFEAGWKPFDNQPSPETFLRDFERYQTSGDLPQAHSGGTGGVYRFSKSQIGSVLALDLREVIAVHVEFKS